VRRERKVSAHLSGIAEQCSIGFQPVSKAIKLRIERWVLDRPEPPLINKALSCAAIGTYRLEAYATLNKLRRSVAGLPRSTASDSPKNEFCR
jgi:hypothetical protein